MKTQFGEEYYAAEETEDFKVHEGDEDDLFDEAYENYDREGDEEGALQMRYVSCSLYFPGYIFTNYINSKDVDDSTSHNGFEELYQLDYEDIVAGIPCRFKYKEVEPESYGLNVEDILLADDKELNRYVGLKRLSTYRKDKLDPSKLSRKRKRLRILLRENREQLSTSKSVEEEETERQPELHLQREGKDPHNGVPDTDTGASKRKRKRNRQKKNA